MVGTLLGVLVGCSGSSGFFASIDAFFMGGAGGFLIGAIIGGIIGYFIDSCEVENEREEIEREYQSAIRKREKNLDDDRKRIEREEKYKQVLVDIKNELTEKKKESLVLLGAMYEHSGIDRRFRTLVAMGYMNEFLILGIATKLEGVDGLYYLIQQRVQYNALKASLDDIANKLDTIISNQDRLYYEIIEMNDKLESMTKEISSAVRVGVENGKALEEIKTNTGVSAYNTERMRCEYEYRNLLGWR
jgi:hypothetical protein